MKNMNFWILFIILLPITHNIHANPESHILEPYIGSAEFEKLKSLVGNWHGTHTMGEETTEAAVIYALTSNDSAIVETLFSGTPHEMVSIYHDHEGKLSMTHYCALGNRPQMDLVSSSENQISLELAARSEIKASTEDHMHALTLSWQNENEITHEWIMHQNGKPSGKTLITLSRK